MIFEIYKDKNFEWRWSLKATNGKILADSAEGYKNKQDMLNIINQIKNLPKYIPIIEVPLSSNSTLAQLLKAHNIK